MSSSSLLRYPFVSFRQYGSENGRDELILFAAKAKDLNAWAGIPRKGWHIRMLFQRPITAGRETELRSFWSQASRPDERGNYVLGPTSVVVALQQPPTLENGLIDISYRQGVDLLGEAPEVISTLASMMLPRVEARLSRDQQSTLRDRATSPFNALPALENDYVFEFALQLQQMKADAAQFIDMHGIDGESQAQIIQSLEAVLRPAIVVDGQHRLAGAAGIDEDVYLPVVAIPNCDWTDQIYQFVVINEKAQKVEPSMLTDIFGSSLTTVEQETIRKKLAKAGVEIESRISAVVAARTAGNPFENMVVFKISGTRPEGMKPFLSERTLRVLIEGSNQKYSRGWRSDEEFYDSYIAPTYPNRDEWDSWNSGLWIEYWYAFWECVRDFYNEQCDRDGGRERLWQQDKQSNLTKAVTLRQMQTLFMQHCIDEMKQIDQSRAVLIGVLKDYALVDEKLDEQRREKAIPKDISDFKAFVRQSFLVEGVPAKFFWTKWKASLDDPQGQQDLWDTLTKAFGKAKAGERFHVRGQIFEASDD